MNNSKTSVCELITCQSQIYIKKRQLTLSVKFPLRSEDVLQKIWCALFSLGMYATRTESYSEIGYLLLPSRDMTEISQKRRKFSK